MTISISMPRGVAAFRERMGGAGGYLAGPSRKPAATHPQFRGSDGRLLREPGIQGFACLYDTTFLANAGFVFLKSGCFSDGLYDQNKKFLLDHNDSKQVGSSQTGL
ncbi:hypothetical protein DK26_19445 [Bosea sp. WAO]|uniref:hypothetical protein n=1 Tax=Bosea sp. WAO TaxID=406341 RepID=UPI0007472C96|nr:hypothetical protein [Bosea sp. WAO]KUL93924.1 hypothetical protein DK26_19445 [Bosea sp. WAO]